MRWKNWLLGCCGRSNRLLYMGTWKWNSGGSRSLIVLILLNKIINKLLVRKQHIKMISDSTQHLVNYLLTIFGKRKVACRLQERMDFHKLSRMILFPSNFTEPGSWVDIKSINDTFLISVSQCVSKRTWLNILDRGFQITRGPPESPDNSFKNFTWTMHQLILNKNVPHLGMNPCQTLKRTSFDL